MNTVYICAHVLLTLFRCKECCTRCISSGKSGRVNPSPSLAENEKNIHTRIIDKHQHKIHLDTRTLKHLITLVFNQFNGQFYFQ